MFSSVLRLKHLSKKVAGASFEMLPPLLLVLYFFASVPRRFPLCKLPLLLLTLEKRLYLREQDTGQSLHNMDWDTCSIVNLLFLSCHCRYLVGLGYPSLFLEQIALKNCTVMQQETAPSVFGYLVGGVGVVQDDLGQNIVGPAAPPSPPARAVHGVLKKKGVFGPFAAG